MLGIPRRHSHFIFGAIQAGLTSLIASGIASLASTHFVKTWLLSWLIAWVTMMPFVLLAAPYIRLLSIWLTEEPEQP